MKKISLLILAIMLLVIGEAHAQNPKTNAGKVNKSPEGYKPPVIPTPPQKPAPAGKKDTIVKSPVPLDSGQQATSYSAPREPHFGNQALFTIGVVVGLTQGQFNTVSDGAWGMGFGITGLYNFMGTDDKEKSLVNVYAGGAFEYLYMGGESNNYSYDEPYPYNGITNTVTTKITSNVYSFLLVSRVELFSGPVVPFIEGAAGFRVFDGNEDVTLDRSQTGSIPSWVTFTPVSDKKTRDLESASTWTYGYGGGLRFTQHFVGIEAKLMYMKGTTAKYIDSESISYNQYSKTFTYQTKTSTTDMLLPSLSLTLTF